MEPGSVTFQGTDRFQLLRLVGQGGMGVVYEALDRTLGASVALKVLPFVSPDRLLRFKREFRAVAEIHHENLVRLGELVRFGDHWFFTMELVRGLDLLEYVRGPARTPEPGESGTVPWSHAASHAASHVASRVTSEATSHEPAAPSRLATVALGDDARRNLHSAPELLPTASTDEVWGTTYDEPKLRQSLLQLARALAALHLAGCVHRDVKPTNVLVTPQGRVVLLDFGLASMGSAESTLFSAGTPLYMAPEQASPRAPTSAADWYGFGVMLFELLTGRLPFQGHVYEVIAAKQAGPAPSVRSVLADAPQDLAELCDALLAQHPEDRPNAERVLRALGDVSEPSRSSQLDLGQDDRASLVGREPEWRELTQVLEHVRNHGQAVALVMRGESGVGKSTLVQRFIDAQAAGGQALAFRGRCHERELVPFKAVDGVLDAVAHMLRHLPADEAKRLVPARASVLAQVFPVLARVDAVAKAPAPDATLDRREVRSWLFGAVRELFVNLGKKQPVLLMVDDFQWADTDSVAMLSEVLRGPDSPRMLLLCTLRTQASMGSATAERTFGSAVDERLITLRNLSADSARVLASRLLGTAPVSDVHRARIAAESGGHPLFLRELAEEAVSAHQSSFDLSLDAVLKRRVERLAATPRQVLSLLAVAGAPLTIPMLREASGMDADDLANAAHALRSARLAHVASDAQPEGLDISHERVRRAVRDGLTADEVRALHLDLAQSLEHSGDSVRSAWHWQEAGESSRAAHHYRAAGERAMQALAFADATQHYRAALLLGDFTDHEQAERRTELGDALSSAGKGAEAAKEYRLAAALVTESRAIELKGRAAQELVRSGYLEEGILAAREVLADAELAIAASPFRALLLQRTRLLFRGLKFRARDERDIDPRDLARIDLCWSFFSGLVLTDHIQGAYFQARALALALASGDRYRIARGIAAEAAYTASRGVRYTAEAERLFRRAEQLVAEVDQPQALGTLLLMRGIGAHMQGSFGKAAQHVAEAATLFRTRCMGSAWELDACRQFWLESAFYLGRLREFAASVRVGLREAEDRGAIYGGTNLRSGLPNAIWLLSDDPARARSELAFGMAQWSQRGFHVQHWYELLGSVHIDLYEGLAEHAHQRMESRFKELTRSHLLRVSHTGAVALHLRGRAALAAAAVATGPARRARLAIVTETRKALARYRMAFASLLEDTLALGVAQLEARLPPPEQLRALVLRLRSSDLGVYAAAIETRFLSDPGALHAEGVRAPEAFARMLIPG